TTFEWIGEQEIFQGPRTYHTVDGDFKEELVLTFEIAPISGNPHGQLNIQYSGEDQRLRRLDITEHISLEEAERVLHSWGY
ncbi:MAG: hypothetical protein ABUS57_16170, partial [Pseudomonadota bacterium]